MTLNSGARSLLDVVAQTDEGWRLEVLATGAIGALPSLPAMQNIVADARMTW